MNEKRLCKDCKWLSGGRCYNINFKDSVTGEPEYEYAKINRGWDTICGEKAIGFEQVTDGQRIDILEQRTDGLVKLLDLHKENHNKRWWQK